VRLISLAEAQILSTTITKGCKVIIFIIFINVPLAYCFYKRGKSDLRYALYQAAFIASTKNRDFMRYYTRKLRGREKEKGIRTKMWVKLAAKMLLIAWTLMKKKEAFDPAYLNVE